MNAIRIITIYNIATPCNWFKGDKVLIPPSISNEEAKRKFEEIEEVNSYIRYTKCPEDPQPPYGKERKRRETIRAFLRKKEDVYIPNMEVLKKHV